MRDKRVQSARGANDEALASSPPSNGAVVLHDCKGLRPLIKYRGGKAKEFSEIERFLPKQYTTYYEPFFGGGATYFRLMPRNAVIGDINEPLMDFYCEVRDHFDKLTAELSSLQEKYEENQKNFRARKAIQPDQRIPNDNEILQRAEILCADYEESFIRANPNDFMYLDPPYDCTFNDYGNMGLANGFDEKEHRRLANCFRRLRCKALMIIGHTPLTEELYGDLVKAEYAKDYAVNIRNRLHSQATHYVVTNFEV